MKRMNFPNRYKQRCIEAEERQAVYDRLTTSQKLELLPEGQCERQRARLTKQLAKEQ